MLHRHQAPAFHNSLPSRIRDHSQRVRPLHRCRTKPKPPGPRIQARLSSTQQPHRYPIPFRIRLRSPAPRPSIRPLFTKRQYPIRPCSRPRRPPPRQTKSTQPSRPRSFRRLPCPCPRTASPPSRLNRQRSPAKQPPPSSPPLLSLLHPQMSKRNRPRFVPCRTPLTLVRSPIYFRLRSALRQPPTLIPRNQLQPRPHCFPRRAPSRHSIQQLRCPQRSSPTRACVTQRPAISILLWDGSASVLKSPAERSMPPSFPHRRKPRTSSARTCPRCTPMSRSSTASNPRSTCPGRTTQTQAADSSNPRTRIHTPRPKTIPQPACPDPLPPPSLHLVHSRRSMLPGRRPLHRAAVTFRYWPELNPRRNGNPVPTLSQRSKQ